MLAIFGGTFAVIVAVSAALTSVTAPTRHALCQPSQPCGAPPAVSRPLVNLSVWRSRAAGFSLEYDHSLFGIVNQSGAAVTLGIRFKDGTTGLVGVHASSGLSPSAAIAQQAAALQGSVAQLARDNSPADEILGPAVGLHSGGAAVFKGELTGPQGVSQTVVVAIESATDGNMTLTATVLGAAGDTGPHSGLYSIADQIINSIKWRGGGSGS